MAQCLHAATKKVPDICCAPTFGRVKPCLERHHLTQLFWMEKLTASPRADYVANAQPDGELMKEIQNIFAVYDDDKSGSLDFEEFSHALNLCGEWSVYLRFIII
eukprot:1155114-Pelagomonas_calceolata.AAC.3